MMGKIHIVQLQIGELFFPSSVTVMDDPPPGATEMPFLLGLDMLKRHQCQMDLGAGVLKFRVAPGQYMETSFLHEKDLSQEQGGTQGFDADKANQEILAAEHRRAENGDKDEDEDAMDVDGDKKKEASKD